MTLSFTETIDGLPNYFIEKIWSGLENIISHGDYDYVPEHMSTWEYTYWQFSLHYYRNKHIEQFGYPWDDGFLPEPKLHTIRANRHSKWGAGRDIHFVINNRQKNRFQFAPVVKCISVQEIWILKFSEEELGVKVDGRNLTSAEVETLAKNDGFDSAADFYKYFFRTSPYPMNFYGKIIHWTDLKY